MVTESVFSIPGLGRLTVDAVLARDFPTIQGVILLFSVAYVADQSAHRPELSVLRPAHPVLMDALVPRAGVEAAAAATAAPAPGAAGEELVGAHRRQRAGAPRAGLAARAAGSASSTPRCSTRPTVDLLPGASGAITLLSRRTRPAQLLDGHRQLRTRHLQPGAVRRPGVARRRRLGCGPEPAVRAGDRPRRGLRALARRHRDAA